MKASIIVTDENGNRWEVDLPIRKIGNESGDPPLSKASGRARKKAASSRNGATSGSTAETPRKESEIDLTLPLRPFMNRYGRGSSGPWKFALLVAHNAKGDFSVEVSSSEIQKQWSKMTGNLGAFNAAFTTRAKDNGWVDSPKFGVYTLLPGWKQGAAENG